jgi:hypothetical protein
MIDELITEIYGLLDRLPPSAELRALHVQAGQCRAATNACRRLGFSDEVQRSLAVKVLHVESDAHALRGAFRRAKRAGGR